MLAFHHLPNQKKNCSVSLNFVLICCLFSGPPKSFDSTSIPILSCVVAWIITNRGSVKWKWTSWYFIRMEHSTSMRIRCPINLRFTMNIIFQQCVCSPCDNIITASILLRWKLLWSVLPNWLDVGKIVHSTTFIFSLFNLKMKR